MGKKHSNWSWDEAEDFEAKLFTAMNARPEERNYQLYIPAGTKKIEYKKEIDWFEAEMARSLSIPASVKSIDEDIFSHFKYLAYVSVDKANESYVSVDGNLYDKEKKRLIFYAGRKEGKTYKIPDGIEVIEKYAFYNSINLENIIIPSSVTAGLDSHCFQCCEKVTSIHVDEANEHYTSVEGSLYDKKIKKLIFYAGGKETKTYKIPDGVLEIEQNSFFNGRNLESIEFPTSFIGNINFYNLFRCDKLSNICVNINNKNYISLDGNLYDKEKKKLIFYAGGKTSNTFVVPDTVSKIESKAFSNGKNLENITVPASTTDIGFFAFHGTKWYEKQSKGFVIINDFLYDYKCEYTEEIKNVKIPDGITIICDAAFFSCVNLTDVVIPNSVTFIGPGAFATCKKLKRITVPEHLDISNVELPEDCEIVRIPSKTDTLEKTNKSVQVEISESTANISVKEENDTNYEDVSMDDFFDRILNEVGKDK